MCENEYDIWTAASVGDIEFIKESITTQTENVNDVNLGQWSCLMYASYYDHSDLVKYLLFCGAEVHLGDRTSLMLAASCGHTNLVKILLENVQDSVQDSKGRLD